MRSLFIYLFLFVFVNRVSSQNNLIIESDILGVWEIGINLEGLDSLAIDGYKHNITEITFLPKGTFELKSFGITRIYGDTCLTSISFGKWKLNNNRLTLKYNDSDYGFFGRVYWAILARNREHIVKVNQDSILVFNEGFYDLERLHEATYTKYYKRLSVTTLVTENGKDSCNNFYNLQPIVLQPESYTFKANYKYLINSLDSTKVVSIPEDRNIDIYYEEHLTDSIYKYKSFYGLGYIDSIYEDSIIVSLYEMDVNLWDEYPSNGYGLNTTASSDGETTPNFLATIDLYNMPEIGLTTNASDVLQGLSAFGMSSGVFTALILAPLLSINYGTGEFRDRRYYQIAGYSLAGAAICLPIFLLSTPKKYTIIPKGGDTDKNHWYLSY